MYGRASAPCEYGQPGLAASPSELRMESPCGGGCASSVLVRGVELGVSDSFVRHFP